MSNPLRRVNSLSALAFALGAVAFVRSVAFGFVYDDHWTIEGAPLDKPLLRILSWLVRGVGREHHIPDETRPAMVASVWIDRALFRDAPAGYHADSVALYAIACVLALWVSFALTSSVRVAVAAAVLFAFAPLHTEVVCAINYREDLLASIGVLVPLVCLLRPGRSTRATEVLALGAFGLGLMSKESAVALVPLVAITGAILPRARERFLAKREIVVGLLGVLVLWLWWRGALVAKGDDLPRAHYASAWARVLATARFAVSVGASTLFPIRPAPEHARMAAASPLWVLPLGAWIASVVLLARRRRARVLALALAIVVIAPLPASPIFAPANEIADRYAFLGVLGAGLAWGELVARLPRRIYMATVTVAGVALWIACQFSAAPWHDDRKLWSEAIACAPTSPRAWVGLSRASRLAGDLDEADRDVDRAIALDPKFVGARVTRSYNLLCRGDVAGARRELAVIHDLGGDRHAGVAKATECAALAPDEARACAR